MPQPDNRRERGAKTQTSQQTVTPQGQKSGTISPISGGAAAAAPVLQIGQQAQIKKTGAELFQAISGAAQGIQQGIQNYNKMYEMVTESEYAEFETSYIQESDRVKSDPAKLKVWMDNQAYKPNRLTAKRFNSLKADVNGKAYEDEENDTWMLRQSKLATMPTHEAMKELSTYMEQTDENSPVYGQMFKQITEYSASVAAVQHRQSASFMENDMRSVNMKLLDTIQKSNPQMPLDDPNIETVLAARALGQVDIDATTGMITMQDGGRPPFHISAITQEDVLHLREQSGLIENPMQINAAIRAARLPSLMKNGGTTGAIDKTRFSMGLANNSLSISAGDDIRTTLTTLPPETKGTEVVSLMGNAANQLMTSEKTDAEKAAGLGAMIDALDYEASSATMQRFEGMEDEEIYEVNTRDLRTALNEMRSGVFQGMTSKAQLQLGTVLGQATDMSQVNLAMQAYGAEIAPMLAEIGYDASVIIRNEDGTYAPMDFADFSAAQQSGKAVTPVQVLFHDPQLGSADIPFALQLDSGAMVGHANSKTLKASNPLSKSIMAISKDIEKVQKIETFVGSPLEFTDAGRVEAMDLLAVRNPALAVETALRNPAAPLIVDGLNDASQQTLRTVLSANKTAGRPLLMDSNLNAPATLKILGLEGNDPKVVKNRILYRYVDPPEGYASMSPKDKAQADQSMLQQAQKMATASEQLGETGFSASLDAAFTDPTKTDTEMPVTLQGIIVEKWNATRLAVDEPDMTLDQILVDPGYASFKQGLKKMLTGNGRMLKVKSMNPNMLDKDILLESAAMGYSEVLARDPGSVLDLNGQPTPPAVDALRAIRSEMEMNSEGGLNSEAILRLATRDTPYLLGVLDTAQADEIFKIFVDGPRNLRLKATEIGTVLKDPKKGVLLVDALMNNLIKSRVNYDLSQNSNVKFQVDENGEQVGTTNPVYFNIMLNGSGQFVDRINARGFTYARSSQTTGAYPPANWSGIVDDVKGSNRGLELSRELNDLEYGHLEGEINPTNPMTDGHWEAGELGGDSGPVIGSRGAMPQSQLDALKAQLKEQQNK